jgi:hypothetical protein
MKAYPPPKQASTCSNFFMGGGVPETSDVKVEPGYYNKRTDQFAPVSSDNLKQAQDFNSQFVQKQKQMNQGRAAPWASYNYDQFRR